MKAAAWTAKGTIEVVERPLPEVKPGWVRIRVASAGICGSDLHYLGQEVPFPGQTPGHEIGGVVDEAGEGAAFAPGTPVVVEGGFACERCRSCLGGHYSHCARLKFLGFSVPGALAEYMVAPSAAVYRLPDAVPPEWGALVEPLAICVRAAHRADIQLGDRVLVLGSGTIGLMSILLAKETGAVAVYATARHPQQQEMARAMGATEVFASSAEAVKALGEASMDVVIETVGGTAPTVADAVQLTRNLGTICVTGVFQGPSAVPMTPVALRELTIVGAFGYSRNHGYADFAIAADLLAKHLERLEPIVTHRFALERSPEAFATAHDKSSGSIKVHLRP
jgi:threonine dehydrogenase-like Zn-dependent dehydrogenase